MPSWIANLDEIPSRLIEMFGEEHFLETARCAVAAGATPPVEYIGSGATADIYCDEDTAYKVSRFTDQARIDSFADEAEWLTSAHGLGFLVARPLYFDAASVVIVRQCVRGRVGTWSDSRELQDLFAEMRGPMREAGWGMPEFKEDSFIDGVLVDASSPIMFGDRLLAAARAAVKGSRDASRDSVQDYTFAIRSDMSDGSIAKRAGNKVLDDLAELVL